MNDLLRNRRDVVSPMSGGTLLGLAAACLALFGALAWMFTSTVQAAPAPHEVRVEGGSNDGGERWTELVLPPANGGQ